MAISACVHLVFLNGMFSTALLPRVLCRGGAGRRRRDQRRTLYHPCRRPKSPETEHESSYAGGRHLCLARTRVPLTLSSAWSSGRLATLSAQSLLDVGESVAALSPGSLLHNQRPCRASWARALRGTSSSRPGLAPWRCLRLTSGRLLGFSGLLYGFAVLASSSKSNSLSRPELAWCSRAATTVICRPPCKCLL